jgi:hypothetical protein
MDWKSDEAGMIITLHTLAKTYKMLPSEALDRATTFDLFVLDAYHRHQRYQEAKQQGKSIAPVTPRLSQEQMRAMIEQAKNFKPPAVKKPKP